MIPPDTPLDSRHPLSADSNGTRPLAKRSRGNPFSPASSSRSSFCSAPCPSRDNRRDQLILQDERAIVPGASGGCSTVLGPSLCVARDSFNRLFVYLFMRERKPSHSATRQKNDRGGGIGSRNAITIDDRSKWLPRANGRDTRVARRRLVYGLFHLISSVARRIRLPFPRRMLHQQSYIG